MTTEKHDRMLRALAVPRFMNEQMRIGKKLSRARRMANHFRRSRNCGKTFRRFLKWVSYCSVLDRQSINRTVTLLEDVLTPLPNTYKRQPNATGRRKALMELIRKYTAHDK